MESLGSRSGGRHLEARAVTVVLFATLLFLTGYSYLIYPILVVAWARLHPRPWRQADVSPRVTIIVSAYNEEAVIRQKIENSFGLDYPADRLQVLVVSDGSTDQTVPIARRFTDSRLAIAELTTRGGKTTGLNVAVPMATGEIVIFTDANAMFPRDAIRKMVRHFADPAIGLVTGWTRYTSETGDPSVSMGLRIYGLLERTTKRGESLVASCVGADGAIFAVRKELYRPLGAEAMNDLLTAFDVVEQGYRAVLDPDLYCTEPATKSAGGELRRQSRIASQVIAGLSSYRRLMTPSHFGPFGFFLFSHKLIRAMVPFFVLLISVISIYALWSENALDAQPFSTWLGGLLVIFVIGVIGLNTGRGGRLTQLAAYFVVALTAHVAGWIRWAGHRNEASWEPER
jgi:cellulose synthase/poly-beta-1,6-N-acetylglucosamine synthase-like glycosyltransferase